MPAVAELMPSILATDALWRPGFALALGFDFDLGRLTRLYCGRRLRGGPGGGIPPAYTFVVVMI